MQVIFVPASTPMGAGSVADLMHLQVPPLTTVVLRASCTMKTLRRLEKHFESPFSYSVFTFSLSHGVLSLHSTQTTRPWPAQAFVGVGWRRQHVGQHRQHGRKNSTPALGNAS